MEGRWDAEMMKSFLEDGYAKLPAGLNGMDGPAYADASLDVDWSLVNPLVKDEHVQKFHESVFLAQLTSQHCTGKKTRSYSNATIGHLAQPTVETQI